MSEDQLPALIDRATRCLAEARSSAEVLEAKAIAEAALHYAKLIKAANATHADCLRMIVRAEMRMADEIDRGQAAGEVPVQGQHAAHVQAADMTDLGVDRRRVAEWRAIRDAGPELVERVIGKALAEERAPTKADIHRAVNGGHFRAAFSGKFEWFTPEMHLDLARQVLGKIDLDPATCEFAQRRVRAARYFTVADDGLAQDWAGKVWLNPPYSQPEIALFAEKMIASFRSGAVPEAIMLTSNYTDTVWFHHAESACAALCFTRGRIRFYDETEEMASPVNGHAFFYYGPNAARFREVFGAIGFIR